MPEGDFSETVRIFIRDHISSVEQLEILLHLFQISPRMESVETIAKALYISTDSASKQLQRFHEHGLVAATKGATQTFGIPDQGSTTGRQIQELAQCYRERRVSVINEIFSNPISTLQTFSDAFIIGKRKESH
jgi:hypothetical protein